MSPLANRGQTSAPQTWDADFANYFTGQVPRVHQPDLTGAIQAGTYRVVDDQLFQLIESCRVLVCLPLPRCESLAELE
jgi:hypothetical protein